MSTQVLTDEEGHVLDPECRFVYDDGHTCRNREGEFLHPGQSCWVEARTQVNEARRVGIDWHASACVDPFEGTLDCCCGLADTIAAHHEAQEATIAEYQQGQGK